MRAEFRFHGIEQANAAFAEVEAAAPHAFVAILTEAGLFGERETKLRTRVDTGRARASIGHFTQGDLTPKATSEDAAAAREAAFWQEPTVQSMEVSWGSRVVYVPVLNYKLGDLMFEHGLNATIGYIPMLCAQYLGELFDS